MYLLPFQILHWHQDDAGNLRSGHECHVGRRVQGELFSLYILFTCQIQVFIITWYTYSLRKCVVYKSISHKDIWSPMGCKTLRWMLLYVDTVEEGIFVMLQLDGNFDTSLFRLGVTTSIASFRFVWRHQHDKMTILCWN